MNRLDRILTKIAKTHLDITTLATRRSDRLDFHDVSVWAVRAALKAAYDAGIEDSGSDASPIRTDDRSLSD